MLSSDLEADSVRTRGDHVGGWSDRLGVFAALACAVHCMAAPLVLAVAPMIGGVWASPRTHWVFAAISIPAAMSLLWRNLRRQSARARRLLIALAVVGSCLILVGLAAPGASWAAGVGVDVTLPSWLQSSSDAAASTGCTDECCASVHRSAEGTNTMHVPIASLVTMCGGVLLVTAHLFALRCRTSCTNTCC